MTVALICFASFAIIFKERKSRSVKRHPVSIAVMTTSLCCDILLIAFKIHIFCYCLAHFPCNILSFWMSKTWLAFDFFSLFLQQRMGLIDRFYVDTAIVWRYLWTKGKFGFFSILDFAERGRFDLDQLKKNGFPFYLSNRVSLKFLIYFLYP